MNTIDSRKPGASTNMGLDHVLFVDHAAQPGGGQLGLLRYLENTSGLKVTVIFLTGGPLIERFRATGHSVIVLSEKEFSFRLALQLTRRLRHVIVEAQPDAVVANSLYCTIPLAAMRRTGATTLYYSRVSMDSLTGLKRRIGMSLLFPRFDGFLANSEWTAACIPVGLLRTRPLRVAYPVSGISPAGFEGRRSSPGAAKPFRIASLSRPDWWKGTDNLIEAVAGLELDDPDCVELVLYGGTFYSDPAFVAKVTAMAQESRVPVRFAGHVDDVDSVLDEVDMVVLSTRFPEPFGQVVVQAMAHGALILVPNQGGPLEVVKDRVNGRTFEANDVDAMRRVIAEAINSPEEIARLAEAGKQHSRTFDDAKTSAGLETAIFECVSEVRAAHS